MPIPRHSCMLRAAQASPRFLLPAKYGRGRRLRRVDDEEHTARTWTRCAIRRRHEVSGGIAVEDVERSAASRRGSGRTMPPLLAGRALASTGWRRRICAEIRDYRRGPRWLRRTPVSPFGRRTCCWFGSGLGCGDRRSAFQRRRVSSPQTSGSRTNASRRGRRQHGVGRDAERDPDT